MKQEEKRIVIIGIIQGGWAQPERGCQHWANLSAILKERRSAQLATRTLTPLRIINE